MCQGNRRELPVQERVHSLMPRGRYPRPRPSRTYLKRTSRLRSKNGPRLWGYGVRQACPGESQGSWMLSDAPVRLQEQSEAQYCLRRRVTRWISLFKRRESRYPHIGRLPEERKHRIDSIPFSLSDLRFLRLGGRPSLHDASTYRRYADVAAFRRRAAGEVPISSRSAISFRIVAGLHPRRYFFIVRARGQGLIYS